MELRCLWTVRGLRKSLWATWALVSPSATSPSTSTSRGVSPAVCSYAEVVGCTDAAEEGVIVEGSPSERAYSNAASIDIARPSSQTADHVLSSSWERAPTK